MMLGLPRCRHDSSIQVTIAVEAEMSVLMKATDAISLGDSALPPLKPNHSSAVQPTNERTLA